MSQWDAEHLYKRLHLLSAKQDELRVLLETLFLPTQREHTLKALQRASNAPDLSKAKAFLKQWLVIQTDQNGEPLPIAAAWPLWERLLERTKRTKQTHDTQPQEPSLLDPKTVAAATEQTPHSTGLSVDEKLAALAKAREATRHQSNPFAASPPHLTKTAKPNDETNATDVVDVTNAVDEHEESEALTKKSERGKETAAAEKREESEEISTKTAQNLTDTEPRTPENGDALPAERPAPEAAKEPPFELLAELRIALLQLYKITPVRYWIATEQIESFVTTRLAHQIKGGNVELSELRNSLCGTDDMPDFVLDAFIHELLRYEFAQNIQFVCTP